MYPSSRWISPVLLAVFAGCASAEGAPASGPSAPATAAAEAPDTAPPAPEPEVPLEARWAAPFAVQSTGQLAVREPRPEVVRLAASPARDTVPLAPVAVDTAAPRAPARATRDTTRTAVRTPAPSSGRQGSAAPPSRAGRRSHEVRPGETFYGVARRYSVTPAALRAENPGVDPERLRSGTTLWIPAAGSAPTSSSSTPSRPAAPARAAARTHTVVSGDTLFGIARKYGVSPAAIRGANRMESDVVKLGQTLVIPAGS
jgi:LysM repeat protein